MNTLSLVEITQNDFDYLKHTHREIKKVEVNKNTNFEEEFFALIKIVEPKYGNDGEKYSLIHLSTPIKGDDKYYKLLVTNN